MTPRNGELIIAPTQDFITGSYLLTRKDNFFNKTQTCQLINSFLTGNDIKVRIALPIPAILKPQPLWTGKQIFSLILRPNKLCPIRANLRAKSKAFDNTDEMCVHDSCNGRYFLMYKFSITVNYFVIIINEIVFSCGYKKFRIAGRNDG